VGKYGLLHFPGIDCFPRVCKLKNPLVRETKYRGKRVIAV
jgi:hypothetical protein